MPPTTEMPRRGPAVATACLSAIHIFSIKSNVNSADALKKNSTVMGGAGQMANGGVDSWKKKTKNKRGEFGRVKCQLPLIHIKTTINIKHLNNHLGQQ